METIVPAVLILSIALGIGMSFAILVARHGNRPANTCYGLLLLFFALSLGRNLSLYVVDTNEPQLLFFYPFWLNLSFGPLLFYFLKWSVFPGYSWHLTDSKHAVAPTGQALFYGLTTVQSAAVKNFLWNHLVSVWYKALEGSAYLISSISYIVFGYRYLKYREALLRRRPVRWAILKVRRLKHFVRVLFILGGVNISYVIVDFVLYNFLQFQVDQVGFTYFGDLSFGIMLLWLVYFGYRYWFALPEMKTRLTDWSDILAKAEENYRFVDGQFRPAVWARLCGLSRKQLTAKCREYAGLSPSEVVAQLRLNSVKKRLVDPAFAHHSLSSIFRESGFQSEKNGTKWFERIEGKSPQRFRSESAA